MKHFIKMFILSVVLSLLPGLSALGGESKIELSGESLKVSFFSNGINTLERKFIKIEAESGVLELQHCLQIGSITNLLQYTKQIGDSIQAVVRNNGQAHLKCDTSLSSTAEGLVFWKL